MQYPLYISSTEPPSPMPSKKGEFSGPSPAVKETFDAPVAVECSNVPDPKRLRQNDKTKPELAVPGTE